MASPEDDLLFEGNDGRECEAFIRTMRRHAWKEGKHEDDKWIAQYAAMFFSGPALRWHSELQPDVRNSWLLLERAMLSRFQSGESGQPRKRFNSEMSVDMPPSNPSIVPTPAAAAPPPNASPPVGGNQWADLSSFFNPSSASTPLEPLERPRQGRIRVTDPSDGALLGYISAKFTAKHKHYTVTASPYPHDALLVEYTQSNGPIILDLVGSPESWKSLGITWAQPFGPSLAGNECAFVVATHGGPLDARVTSSTYAKGPTMSSIWTIYSDSSLIAHEPDHEGALHVMVSDDKIRLVHNPKALRSTTSNRWDEARLSFEPQQS